MRVVYAMTTAVIGHAMVRMGQHWPANDPLVLANPDFFSDDPKYGLVFTREPIPEEPRVKRAYVRRS